MATGAYDSSQPFPRVAARARGAGVTSERETLMTAEEVAQRWKVSSDVVYRLAREGGLACVQLGRYRRFRVATVEAFEVASEGRSDG